MRIFLTGATGFVGRHVAAALAERGHDLVCLARSRPRAAHLLEAGHRVVEGDLGDPAALAGGVDGAGVVVHVAGLVAARSRSEMRAVNVAGTGRLAAVCAAAAAPPARFVLVSSLAAGGPATPAAPRTESDPPRPVSDYGRSKLDGERAAARALRGRCDLVVVRPPAVYGPYDRGILEFFRAAARGFVPRIGALPRSVSIVHGADLARLVARCIERPEAAGATFHGANDEVATMTDLVQRIARAVGRPVRALPLPDCLVRAAGAVVEEVARARGRVPTFSRDKAREFLAPGWVCTSERATAELDWRPEIELDRGLRETAVWYRAAGWIE